MLLLIWSVRGPRFHPPFTQHAHKPGGASCQSTASPTCSRWSTYLLPSPSRNGSPVTACQAVDIRQRCPVPLLLLVDPGHCPPPGVVGPPCFRLMTLGVVLDPFGSSGASSACVCHEARILFASLTPWQASCFGGSPPTKQLRRDLNAETKNYFS